VLMLNGMRHQVRLRTDGGLRTGRDIVVAAILGAEEFGIGTASLIAVGCLMVRQCHSNTCPVGVCTQDERLRARFSGTPEKVINLMTFIAQEVRELLAEIGFRTLQDVIGRTDLLMQISRGAEHLDDLDLNPLLVRVESPDPPYCTRTSRREPAPSLDEAWLGSGSVVAAQVRAFLETGTAATIAAAVRNTDRAIGSRLSAHVLRRFGPAGPPEPLTLRLTGSCGQSLGAFLVAGVAIAVEGDANDYVGKGLSGGRIALFPSPEAAIRARGDAIIGNTCLYGATSGALFAAGQAGERFAVRNSGATAVIEGCGANGCEYMTGGDVMILGPVGANFGAGMTGGQAFLLDPEGHFERHANLETIAFEPLAGSGGEEHARTLLQEHVARTGSVLGAALLADWPRAAAAMIRVRPRAVLAPAPVAARATALA